MGSQSETVSPQLRIHREKYNRKCLLGDVYNPVKEDTNIALTQNRLAESVSRNVAGIDIRNQWRMDKV